MRFFTLVDFKYITLAFFLGLVSLVLVYVAWGIYPRRDKLRTAEEPKEGEEHEVQTGHGSEDNPVAPFLILIYIGIAVCSVAYMLIVGIRGGPVGY